MSPLTQSLLILYSYCQQLQREKKIMGKYLFPGGVISMLIVLIILVSVKSTALNGIHCQNGGVLKKLVGEKICFCEGTRHYGTFCEIPCQFEKHEFLVGQKCLNESCKEIPTSCMDTTLYVNHDIDDYPLCEKILEKCVDEMKMIFKSTEKCQNGGVLRKINHTSICMCKGTKHFGDFCQKPCDTLGFDISEKCLNGKCDVPDSCLDLSREKININRCQNGGMFVVGKNNNTCSCFGTGFWGEFCQHRCISSKYPPECIF